MEYKLPAKFQGTRILSSEVSNGGMNLDDPDGLKRAVDFLSSNKVVEPYAYVGQSHITKILQTDSAGEVGEADGILTRKNLALGVRTADCVPIMVFEKQSGLIGAIHASRKTLLNGIIYNFAATIKKLEIKAEDVVCFIGPHIRVANYPIKPETVETIENTRFARFIKKYPEHKHFDLTEALLFELDCSHFKRDNIFDFGIDNFLDERFFSSRRRKDNEPLKTFLTAIVRED